MVVVFRSNLQCSFALSRFPSHVHAKPIRVQTEIVGGSTWFILVHKNHNTLHSIHRLSVWVQLTVFSENSPKVVLFNP